MVDCDLKWLENAWMKIYYDKIFHIALCSNEGLFIESSSGSAGYSAEMWTEGAKSWWAKDESTWWAPSVNISAKREIFMKQSEGKCKQINV